MIENKIEKSGLITIDLDDFILPKTAFAFFNLSDYLEHDIILKERAFREALKQTDWSIYEHKYIIITPPPQAILPKWTPLLITSHLMQINNKGVFWGDENAALEYFMQKNIRDLDVLEYHDKKVILKGCSDKRVSDQCYMILIEKLSSVVFSLMYGEACSTVPLYKKKVKG